MTAFGRNRTLRDECYYSVYKIVRLEFSLTILVDLSSKLASSDDKNSFVAELSHENWGLPVPPDKSLSVHFCCTTHTVKKLNTRY